MDKHTNIQTYNHALQRACSGFSLVPLYMRVHTLYMRAHGINIMFIIVIHCTSCSLHLLYRHQVYFSSRMFWGEKNAHFNYSFHWSVTNSLFSQFLSLQTIYICFEWQSIPYTLNIFLLHWRRVRIARDICTSDECSVSSLQTHHPRALFECSLKTLFCSYDRCCPAVVNKNNEQLLFTMNIRRH